MVILNVIKDRLLGFRQRNQAKGLKQANKQYNTIGPERGRPTEGQVLEEILGPDTAKEDRTNPKSKQPKTTEGKQGEDAENQFH